MFAVWYHSKYAGNQQSSSELCVSVPALNAYRKSVFGLNDEDQSFGRRMSLISTSGLLSPSPPVQQLDKIGKTTWSSLVANPKFYLYMAHGFFSFVAFLLPQQFVPSQMVSVGLSRRSGTKAIGCLAIANLVGRLSSGLIMDYPKVGVVKAYILSHLMAVLTIMSLQFCVDDMSSGSRRWRR